MRRYLASLFIVFALIEIYSVRPHHPEALDPSDPGIKHFLSGAIHVHTTASDGGADVTAIAADAKRAGLDFVVITDIDNSKARSEEGHYDKVDVFVEMEVSTNAGQMLTFYSHTDTIKEKDARVAKLAWQHFQGPLEDRNATGLFNIVAHPSHPGKPWNAFDRQPEGIEIFNFDSLWRKAREESVVSFATTMLLYPFSNFLTALRITQGNRKDLIAWDAMNAISPGRFGVLAQHSHASVRLGGNLKIAWPQHVQAFKTAATVLFYEPPLAADYEARKKQTYQLLRTGQSAMVFNFIHPFNGNDWTLECGEKTYRSGARVAKPASAKDCEFRVRLPKNLGYPAHLRLWKSGELVREVMVPERPDSATPSVTDRDGLKIGLEDGPGVYRLEVWLEIHTLFRVLLTGESPYVFYNPIYVE